MIHIIILLALLVILAALHFLAKYKDVLTSFLKWSAYGIILVAILVIICNLSRGIFRMRYHHQKCENTEQCSPGMHNGMGASMHDKGCEMGGRCGHGMCMNMGRGMCQGSCMNMSGCCMEGHNRMGSCCNQSGNKGCGEDNEEGEIRMEYHRGDSMMKKEIRKDSKIDKK